jgi:hypothetical protein
MPKSFGVLCEGGNYAVGNIDHVSAYAFSENIMFVTGAAAGCGYLEG